MRIQIFTASMGGADRSIQRDVNKWLEEHDRIYEIVSITPTVCTVGPAEDQYQEIMMTVVYRDRD